MAHEDVREDYFQAVDELDALTNVHKLLVEEGKLLVLEGRKVCISCRLLIKINKILTFKSIIGIFNICIYKYTDSKRSKR